LPNAKPVVSTSMPPPPPEGAGKSSFALRELGLHRIDVALSLGQVKGQCVGQIRPMHVAELTVEGQLVHTPDETSPPGRILGGAKDAALSIHGLDLGTQILDAAQIVIGSAVDFDISFADIAPTALSINVDSSNIDGLFLRAPAVVGAR